MMRGGLELTETEKLEQLSRMIVAGKMEEDDPWKEFKDLLSSLPVELVINFGTEHILLYIMHSPVKPFFCQKIAFSLKNYTPGEHHLGGSKGKQRREKHIATSKREISKKPMKV